MSDLHKLPDAELLALLGDGLNQADPVPGIVVERAISAFWWPRIQTELAKLTFDSIDFAPAAARTDNRIRMLTFQSKSHVVDLEFSRDDALLLGVVQPAEEYKIEVIGAGGTTSNISDSQGRFGAELTQTGPMSLLVNRGSEPVLRTELILL